jgi:xanthine/uracil permease
VATVAGAILVALGLVPKLGAVVAGLPGPVVGAAGLVMFATVAAVGISTLRKVEFEGTQNLLIVAVSIGVGMAPDVAPDLYSRFPDGVRIVLGSPVTSATLIAFGLNLAFNRTRPARTADDEAAAEAKAKAKAEAEAKAEEQTRQTSTTPAEYVP